MKTQIGTSLNRKTKSSYFQIERDWQHKSLPKKVKQTLQTLVMAGLCYAYHCNLTKIFVSTKYFSNALTKLINPNACNKRFMLPRRNLQ